jgi:FkbM family methyltransferase
MTEQVTRPTGIYGMLLELLASGFYPLRILDIGANTGQSARLFHGVWPLAHVTSIEANERCLQTLSLFADEVHHAMVSDSEREVTFWEHDANEVSLGNSYYQETLGCFPHTRPVQRQTTTLASLLAGKPPYELVKLDIQGAELDAIRGGRDIIRQARYVICETQYPPPTNAGAPLREDIERELAELGFGDGILLEWWIEKNTNRRVAEDWIYRRVDGK